MSIYPCKYVNDWGYIYVKLNVTRPRIKKMNMYIYRWPRESWSLHNEMQYRIYNTEERLSTSRRLHYSLSLLELPRLGAASADPP
jgi:hypothetical protein